MPKTPFLGAIPELMYFGNDSKQEIRTQNLHLYLKGSGGWNDELLFRDYLRLNKELASAYIESKIINFFE
jgi:GrpB-like predicted nucleotidyltransferase (UPF0157 family)